MQDLNGNCPIHTAVLQKSYECVKILKYYKADMNVRNFAGETAMQMSQRLKDFDMLSFFQLTDEQIISSNQNNLVKCIPSIYSSNTFGFKDVKEYHHPNQQNLLMDDDPNNIGIEFGFNQINPLNKINTMKFKNRSKSYVRMANQNFPPIIQVVASHSPLFHEQLQLLPGDMVQVILILNTKTAFGRKQTRNGYEYGWFPSSCIALDNYDVILKFNKTYFLKQNFEELKDLNKISYYGIIPILKEIVISYKDFQLGMELSYKNENSSTSILDAKNPLLISPHYVKSVKENSLCNDYEFRVGDRILAINGVDVTHFTRSQVSEIVKKIVLHSKKLQGVKSDSISSLKWFKKRAPCVKEERQDVYFLIGRYHVPQLSQQQSLSFANVGFCFYFDC